MISLVIAIIICIVFSGYFSATETAFSTFNKIKMKNEANAGNKRAQLVMELSEDYDRLLSTILIGNNVVNIVAATLATMLFTELISGAAGPTVSTVVMTVIVLIFGEVSPKSIAKDIPETFAKGAAPLLRVIYISLKPLNYLFTLWKKLLNKILKINNTDSITEEEILTIVEEAQQEGTLNERETDLIKNALEFDDLEVSEICTPRTNIIAIKDTATNEEVKDVLNKCGFSRIPVYTKSLDNIMGFINQKDFYRYVIEGHKTLKEIIKPIPLVPPTTNISKLMRSMQEKHSQIVLIIDEYGGTYGIITLEDILEELVGEIWDEHDNEIPDMVKLGEGEYSVLGTANLNDIFEFFGKTCDSDFVSINGWLSEKLERIPRENDTVMYKNLVFTITKANHKRALEVKIQQFPEDNDDDND